MKSRLIAVLLFGVHSVASHTALAASGPALQLQERIGLGVVRGRIDHLAIDLRRQRLFVAELGNDTVGVVDLENHKVVRRLASLHEPQGVAYSAVADALYVANARDGSVRIFQGEDLRPGGTVVLGEDADNVRGDDAAHRVWIGYGSGALAVIDTSTGRRLRNIPLHGHPEGFQLASNSAVAFVNVPGASEIAVVDRQLARQIAAWPTGKLASNFPMAYDEPTHRVFAIFRAPPALAVFSDPSGRLMTTVATCGDADDVFVDSAHRRVYVICGEGFIDVFEESGQTYRRQGRVPTAAGARTGLFVPSRGQLMIAGRATATMPAAVWIYRVIE